MFEKNINTIDIQTIMVLFIVILITSLRVIPHIENFSPLISLAIFSSIHFRNKIFCYIALFLSLWISDFFINNFVYNTSTNIIWFYKGFYWQYFSYFAILILSSFFYGQKISLKSVSILAISSSFIFFFVTNFGFWIISDLYEKNLHGLIHCYIAGIPYIKGTIIGSFFYTYLLFGGYYLLQEKIYFLKRSHINY